MVSRKAVYGSENVKAGLVRWIRVLFISFKYHRPSWIQRPSGQKFRGLKTGHHNTQSDVLLNA